MSEWKDIRSAPVNTEVQTWCRVYDWRPQCRLIERGDGKRQWQEWGLDGFEGLGWVRMSVEPTHWMPTSLPPPPKGGE
jgi:hypothetical protein